MWKCTAVVVVYTWLIILYILYTIVVLPRDDIRPDKGQVRSTGINNGGTGGTNWGGGGARLLLRSNRKSYRPTRFRLVPKSMTLNDLEGSLCSLFQNTCVFRSLLWKFEWRYIYTVSDNIRFVPIFEGYIGERASYDSGVIENMDFHGFRRYVFGSFGNQTKAIIQ